MRRLLVTLHLWVAAIVGAFVLLLGLSGAVMAFEPELEHLLHPSLWYVTPGPTVQSLQTLGAAALAAVPGQRIQGYSLSTAPNLSYQVQLRGPLVFVNQYTGAVLGVGTPGPDVLNTVHQLHLRLGLLTHPQLGKAIVSWSAVGLVWLLVTGVYLWWPLKRVGVRPTGIAWRFWFDLHNTTGILALAVLLALVPTGLAIGFDDVAVPWAYRITGTTPHVMYGRMPAFHVTPTGHPMTPDEAVALARTALPGAAPISVNVPGPTGVYLIAARYPEDLTPGGRSRIAIDPYTRQVLFAEGSRTAPAGTRLVTLNRAIHTGDIGGLAGKTIVCLASVALALQVVTGLMTWWRRRESRPRRS